VKNPVRNDANINAESGMFSGGLFDNNDEKKEAPGLGLFDKGKEEETKTDNQKD
jgi:hypothetical protein